MHFYDYAGLLHFWNQRTTTNIQRFLLLKEFEQIVCQNQISIWLARLFKINDFTIHGSVSRSWVSLPSRCRGQRERFVANDFHSYRHLFLRPEIMAPNTVMSPPPASILSRGKKKLHRLIEPVSRDCLEKDSLSSSLSRQSLMFVDWRRRVSWWQMENKYKYLMKTFLWHETWDMCEIVSGR